MTARGAVCDAVCQTRDNFVYDDVRAKMQPYITMYAALIEMTMINNKSPRRERITEKESMMCFIHGVEGIPMDEVLETEIFKSAFLDAEYEMVRVVLMGHVRERRSQLSKTESRFWKEVCGGVENAFLNIGDIGEKPTAVTLMGEYGKSNQKATKELPFRHASPAQPLVLYSQHMISQSGTMMPVLGNNRVEEFVRKMGEHVATLRATAEENVGGPRMEDAFTGLLPNGKLGEDSDVITFGYFVSTLPILFSKWCVAPNAHMLAIARARHRARASARHRALAHYWHFVCACSAALSPTRPST